MYLYVSSFYVIFFVFCHFVFAIFPTPLPGKPWENERAHITDFLAYFWTVFVLLYFGIFISVSSYFVFLYSQFFRLSSPESPGEMPLRTREPICLKYSRPHIEIHRKVPLPQAKHQPAKYQQKWDTKSKCFFVAAMNLTWAGSYFDNFSKN